MLLRRLQLQHEQPCLSTRRFSVPLSLNSGSVRCNSTRSNSSSSSTSTKSGTDDPLITPVASPPTNVSILGYPYEFVDTPAALQRAVRALGASSRFSLDIEAFCTAGEQKHLGTISLLQMCSTVEPVVFLLDVVTLGKQQVFDAIRPVMTDNKIQKLMFDCRRDVEAMSAQMQLKPRAVLDLQLFFTAIQWKQKSTNRRSGMSYVIKSECGVARQEGDSAVQAAMTLGNRPVWDIRPLPSHFMEYAAGDVRHILLLAEKLVNAYPSEFTYRVERLSGQYVEHYAAGKLVEVEADPKPHDVSTDWLEMHIGPGGKCGFCGSRGHTETECFKKQSNVMKCTHCGDPGHMAKNCYKKFPHLLKCELCGQMGHSGARCFQRNRCRHCGGQHSAENCHQYAKQQRKAEREAQEATAAASSQSSKPPSL